MRILRQSLIFAFVLGLGFVAPAQNYISIVDGQTGQPISFAHVLIEGIGCGFKGQLVSDASGRIPNNTTCASCLRITFVGYKPYNDTIQPGKNIEQAHMRGRKLIATWCYEQGKADSVIQKLSKDGKTFTRINDYKKLQALFGKLLGEIQRIKSEGDYQAGKNLVESFAVQVDPVLHQEMLERYKRLNIAPYAGFINPILTPVYSGDTISDITITYPEDFAGQMLYYSRNYSFLPVRN